MNSSLLLQRTRNLVCLLLTIIAFCYSSFSRAEDIKKIQPTGYVIDLAGVLKPETIAKLEAMCKELEEKTGAQMAIVTVKSLDGNEIEPYINDLFKQLGIGGKKADNGVLFLVAPNDRKYHIEVGYGLEPILNDARVGDAGRLVPPFFRQGDFDGGISAAAWQLAKYIADDKGITLTGMPEIRQVRRQQDSGGLGIWVFLLILVIVIMMAGRGSSGTGRGGSGMGNIAAGMAGWMLGGGGGGWGGGGSGGGGWGGGGGGGGGFGGFGGGSSGGGGAGGSW